MGQGRGGECLRKHLDSSSLQWRAQHLADGHAAACRRFGNLIPEEKRNAAHQPYRQVRSSVGYHVAEEETAELMEQEGVDGRVGAMPVEERGKGGQEAVGHGFAVNAAYHFVGREAVGGKKVGADFLRQLVFQHIAHEQPSQHGSAALIAQHVAQRRHVVYHFPPEKQAAVAAGAHDAGYARAVRQQGVGCSCQVRIHHDGLCLGEHLLQRLPYHVTLRPPATGSEEADFRHLRRKAGERRVVAQQALDGCLVQHERIDAWCLMAEHFLTVCLSHPRGFGAAAVGIE